MQVVVWIIIILVIVFLIWLLRRWIKRLIFILILLALAFFIYGIFSPSGAARLWYNVRTFPERMASWMGSGKEFLDYNTYKSKISSIGDSIGDTVDSIGAKIDLASDSGIGDLGSDVGFHLDSKFDEKEEKNVDKDVEKTIEKDTSSSKEQTIKAFPKSVKFVDIPNLKDVNKQESILGDNSILTGYSKSDLFGIINNYLEKNLDDDTDILVTVEYEDDNADPQKIILQTKQRGK